MHTTLLHLHSSLRYLVLLALIVVVIKSLWGWLGKKPYSNLDNRVSLYLFIFTHMQLLVGMVLYFVSDLVQFNASTMKNKDLRYWAVEHLTIMLIAIVLITMARITSRKLSGDEARHKRMFIFNAIALVLIITGIIMSGREMI